MSDPAATDYADLEAQVTAIVAVLQAHVPRGAIPDAVARTIAWDIITRLNTEGFDISYRWQR